LVFAHKPFPPYVSTIALRFLSAVVATRRHYTGAPRPGSTGVRMRRRVWGQRAAAEVTSPLRPARPDLHKSLNSEQEATQMDIFGFRVTADGSIVGGPEGWTAQLVGVTYTVIHNGNTELVPAVTAIGEGQVAAQLTDVGPQSFSWKNRKFMQGTVTTYDTAVRVVPPPDYYTTP
jgi:hypothetical protein